MEITVHRRPARPRFRPRCQWAIPHDRRRDSPFDHPALPASWRNAQVWLPLAWDSRVTSPDDTTLSVLARAPEGIEPAAAAARLETEAEAVNNGANNGDRKVRVRPMDLSVSPTTRAMILTAMGAAIFVLLIACTNVANLLLLKAVARREKSRPGWRSVHRARESSANSSSKRSARRRGRARRSTLGTIRTRFASSRDVDRRPSRYRSTRRLWPCPSAPPC